MRHRRGRAAMPARSQLPRPVQVALCGDRAAVVARRAAARARSAVRARAADAVQLALRSAAQLQRPDATGAARVAARSRRHGCSRSPGRPAWGKPSRSRMIDVRVGAGRYNRRRHELLQAPRVLLLQPARAAGDAAAPITGALEMQAIRRRARIKALGLIGQGPGAHQQGRLPRSLRGRSGARRVSGRRSGTRTSTSHDIDEIIDRHVVGGEIVERLRI